MSVLAAAQKADSNSEMQSPAVSPSFLPSQPGKIPGRKRGRPPLHRKMDFPTHYPESLPPLKVPKKRGRKPGFKLKPRMVMTPLAISPPSSTPEPDMSSIPQDAATIPHSATPQVLTVCIYINKQANMGPNLDRKKLQQLPDHFGPDRPSVVLQQAVQGCIDSAFQQKAVFTLLTQGYGGEKISATFDAETSMPEEYLLDPSDKRYSMDPAYNPSQDSQESKVPPRKDPSTWSVEDVVWFIRDADPQSLGPHVDIFRKHEIDGNALLLLKSDMIMKYLGLKLGPALKLCYHIDKLKQNKF
ncbi:sex comb on midleg-like protein 4 isoform X4 [Coregonus clupeaformis]|uniref:sex comb on midleg-like protein 4 isoform X4 n=1 Tax=Coregonus clupeaformis TaxID=59861 RepID=UPI001BDFC732|nr:sex comb on midleg-like protein 4 isoform X4 [Coregonus clupeaformis]